MKCSMISVKPSLSEIALSFFKLGCVAFGGPAMIVHIRKMAVEEKRWVSDDSFKTGIALCQSIPGATAIQSTAYVGLKIRGIAGAVCAFISFGLPAFILMMALSALYVRFHETPSAIRALGGLKIIVVSIVAHATWSLGKTTAHRIRESIIIISAAALFMANLQPISVIILSALAGMLVFRKNVLEQKTALTECIKYNGWHYLNLIFLEILGFSFLYAFQKPLFELAVLVFRIDLFAYGGGFASIPLMLHEMVEVRNWMDPATFMSGIALGQITPGPIVITATFAGYIAFGFWGGVVATCGIFSPSFLLLVGAAPYWERLRKSFVFRCAITGVICSFIGLLLATTIKFSIQIHWDWLKLILASAALGALIKNVKLPFIILGGICLSLCAPI
jgi:chromate transporter